MKNNLRKGISVLLCLAMMFAMMPNFLVIRANAEDLIGYESVDTAAETENEAGSPEENGKTDGSDVDLEDEAVGNDQPEVSGAGETNTTGTWADQDESGKYKYADFSPFLDEEGNWIEPSDKTYTISTNEQLAGLMVIVNADTNTTIIDKYNKGVTIENTQVSFHGYTIKLTADIDLSAHEWVPIGKDNNHPFNASLDGSGTESGICKIQGMKIGSATVGRNYKYAGLIGYVKYSFNHKVSNVGIDNNSRIYVQSHTDAYVGGIIGYTATLTTVTNCYNTGEIIGLSKSASMEDVHVGGITGCATQGITITNCYNTGRIVGSAYIIANQSTGGIIGCASRNDYNKIKNCYNTGDITCIISSQITKKACGGGIIGSINELDINNCYSTGTVTMNYYNGTAYSGGIIGGPINDITQIQISNCYYLGATQGIGKYVDRLGVSKLLKDVKADGEEISVTVGNTDETTISNTEANTNLREDNTKEGASQKLGAGFIMEYAYDTPENVTIGPQNGTNNLQISVPNGAKSGEVTFTGIKVTQNTLTADGYTGAPFTFNIGVNEGTEGTSFNLSVKYKLSFDLSDGEWVGIDEPPVIEYTQGEGSSTALPTSENIKRGGYTFIGWNTQKDGSGDYIEKVDENLAASVLYAQYSNSWGDFVSNEQDAERTYNYADFSPFLNAEGNWMEPKDGTTYTISTAEELAGLMVITNLQLDGDNLKVNYTNGGIKRETTFIADTLEGRQSFAGYTIKLENNIDLNGHEWVPIGLNYGCPFSANFDGNEKVIQNMKIGSKGLPVDYEGVGFIGSVVHQGDKANIISNITIDENSAMYVSAGYMDVGGIIGEANSAVINNCKNNGTINVSYNGEASSEAEISAGGIVGRANNLTINNCSNTGSIIIKPIQGNVSVGGIIGGIDFYSTTINVNNCHNDGAIDASSTGKDVSSVGGIIGCVLKPMITTYANADDSKEISIMNCYNTGSINSSQSTSVIIYVGGIMGTASNTFSVEINNCYNKGNITIPEVLGVYAGGIIGYTQASATLNNCYNTGEIDCSSKKYGENEHGVYVGGIIGYVIATARPIIAGIANPDSDTDEIVNINNCYSIGTLTESANLEVGGIMGHIAGDLIKLVNCYYLGADNGVGNNTEGDRDGVISLFKDVPTNGISVKADGENQLIDNTEANTNLRDDEASHKLGANFKMEYVYKAPDNVTIGPLDNGNNQLPISVTNGAKSGPVPLTGIKVTQNGLTENGYTGAASDSEVLVEGKDFVLFVNYTLTLNPNDGSWVGEHQETIEYTQGVFHETDLPTNIEKDGYAFVCWNTKSDGTGDDVSKIDSSFAANMQLYAKLKAINYNVVIDESIENGSVTADPEAAVEGTEVTLTVVPDEGYRLVEGSLTVTTGDENVELKDAGNNKYTFEMPDRTVTVIGAFERDPNYHEIIIEPNEFVGIETSVRYAKPGETVEGWLYPKDDYMIDRVYVNDEEVKLNSDKDFTFTMPDEDAVIRVTMQELDGWVRDPIKCEETGTSWWYYYKDGKKLTGWQEIEIQVEGRAEQVQRYYFDPDRENSAHTGWMKDENSNWYYFAVNHYRNNTLLETPEQGLAMMWTGWANDGGPEWYYLDAVKQDFASGRGIMRTGWIQDGGKEWYYLRPDDTQSSIYGSIVIGWSYIDGKWYYFTDDESENMKYYGQMQIGWQLIDGYWYCFYDDGAMASNTWIGDYFVDENGRWIP